MENRIDKFKLQLTFFSLVKLSALIGFCFGVVSIPLVLLSIFYNPDISSDDFFSILPTIIVVTPIAGTLNGAFFGLIGYPLYKWLSSKVGFVYSGMVYANE